MSDQRLTPAQLEQLRMIARGEMPGHLRLPSGLVERSLNGAVLTVRGRETLAMHGHHRSQD